MLSGSLIDLRPGGPRKRAQRSQLPLFRFRPFHEPESPKRPAPLRTRRRKARALVALGILILLAGMAYALSWASYLPQVSIGSISVVGAKDVSEELIRRHVEAVLDDGSRHVLSRSNIFFYPREVIEGAIEGFFPRIKSAHTSRSSFLSTTLTVAVEERQLFAKWCLSNQSTSTSLSARCYSMDEGGFMFAEIENATAQQSHSSHYVFHGGVDSENPIGGIFAPGHLPGLLSLLELLGQAGFEAEGATIDGEQDLRVPFKEGFTVKASFGQDASTLTKNLELVLSSDALRNKEADIEYIDLRFENRVYYKLKGGEQQGT